MNPAKMIEKVIGNFLNLLPGGWKSITGGALIVGLMAANEFHWLTQVQVDYWIIWAKALFGVGLYHKALAK